MAKRPKRTPKAPERIKVHLWLGTQLADLVDKQAETERRSERTEMIRVLIERGLGLEVIRKARERVAAQ